ncbi:DUF1129 family protein [Lacticaseibacillus saniviri]|uniref:Membrane-associated protein n=2 Tax=Lacticaseibacillus saniviri TaxID=931533 RepID=A0A0R2MS40_9LACO|nr:DUF1129 family protein [Lacticaseibacillus saniviri]KRO16390.1 membrane-associated protein [Lacticaseibacillus saniviri JCM 17471 = DSM 24301]MCG4281058.1 DUF1129 domain-containing protein [Lacticaseibacillus saniviri]
MTEEKTTPEEKNAQVSQERPQASVDELMTQLSKKNDDYVFKLRRGLEEHKVPEAKQEAVLAELLPEIITAQKQGKPANQLYGPVTEKVNAIVFAPKPVKVQPLWLTMLDMGLFFLSLFALVYGVGAYINPKNQPQGGLLPMLIMAVVAAVIFGYYNNWTKQKKGERRSGWIIGLSAFLLITLASFGSSALAQLKSPITNPMPWYGYAVVAVIAYGAHWLMKRQYNLKSVFTV